MDVYFTDRKFNVLGIATTGGHGPISIINDVDDQLAPNSVGRSYTGTLITDQTNSAKLAEMAALGNFVLYQDPRGKYVFATVMDWPDPGYDPQSGELNFVAENGGIDLINETVGAYKATKALPIADYIKLFTSDSGFEIGTNEIATLSRTLEWDSTDETALARIESVAAQFDNAELDFRFEIDGTAVVKRYIDIYKHIGSDKGQRLEVNTQVNSIKTTGNIYDLFTSIEATGGTPDGKDVPVTLKGYKWTDPDGRYVLGDDGILRDTVAVQLWSRTLSNDNPTPTNHHIQRVKAYDATTQATLMQSALADLKQANHVILNYVVDVADLPDQVQVGDTVHLVDEDQGLNLSARLLELKDSYANDTHEATLGDYLIEANQVDPALQEVADQLKTLKHTAHWYPWTRYADNDQGAGISSLPLGKAYMAVVWGKTATPSDYSSDYAGHWQKVTGADGADGVPGPNGADGRTSYFHTAWADSINGSIGFTTSGGNGKKYIGTYSDFTLSDSPDPAVYNWALFKGEDGGVGPKGDQGLPGTNGSDGRTTYAHFAYANSQDGNTDFSTTVSNRKYIGFYSDFSSGDNTNPSAYNWSLIKGADGADGKDGVPGKAGADGKTPYFHIAYADSSDGNTNFSLDTPGSRKYIGSYTDFTQSDSTNPALYSWQLVQGPKGDTGKDGVAGKDGVGLKSTTITYQASTSGTTAPTGAWVASPTAIAGQYQWTRTVWTYTDGTTETGYSVGHIGANGATGKDGVAGKDGVGITTTAVTYQASTSGTTAPTGTWSTSIPSVTAGNYLWTKTVWAYTDGTSETGYSVAMMGKTGPSGKDGPQGATGPKGPTGHKGATGPQGPKGSDITSYASGMTLPSTVAPANSQFWLVNSNNIAIKFYKSTGSAWVEQQISASAINAATFNGLSFNGVTFTGSKFTSMFSNVQPLGFSQKASGTSTLSDGSLVTDVFQNGTSTKVAHNEFNPFGVVTQQYVGGEVAMQALLGQGQLTLAGKFQPLAGGTPVWNESTLSARTLYLLNNTGKAIWNGVSLMGSDQAINAKVLLENTLIGWVFQWSQYDTVANKSIDRNWTYCLVPKVHNIGHNPNQGWNVEMPIVIPNKGNFTKIVWIANSQIGGDKSGTIGLQINACLRAIYAV